MSTRPDAGVPQSLTIEAGSLALQVGAADATAALARSRKRTRNLAYELVEDIGDKIRRKELRPGDKLPTEMAIMETYGVSRTVVRDAVSRLQASGLVETHHGIGTFVLEERADSGFKLKASDNKAPVDVLAALELRIGVETETAGLAALRRTDAHLRAMRSALDDFAANVDQAGDTVSPDFRFHLAIAEATGNPYIMEIYSHLGATLIPRTRINSSRLSTDQLPSYLGMVNREHEEIFEAISRGDAESARAAMRIHLSNSRVRQMRKS